MSIAIQEVRAIILHKLIFTYIAINKYCKEKNLKCTLLFKKGIIKVLKKDNTNMCFILILSKKYIVKKINSFRHNQNSDNYVPIVLISKNIDINYLFSNHLELYGIIDMEEINSYQELNRIIKDYLDEYFSPYLT